MNLFARDHGALQDMAEKEVVVHCLGDDLGHGRGVELDEAVVLGTASLKVGQL